MKWKLVTNVGFADYRDARMWCHAFLIDMEGRKGFGDDIRQMRGLTYGGMPVFTVWIDTSSPVEIKDAEGNAVLMSNDGNTYNLGGLIVSAKGRDGAPVVVGLGIDDFKGKMVVEDVEQEGAPFGGEIDERILHHAGGKAYPSVVWKPIPDRTRKVHA